MKAFVWGCVAILALLVGHAYPSQDQLWLVKFPNNHNTPDKIGSVFLHDAQLVDVLSDTTYIIRPGPRSSVADYYKAGALLVVNQVSAAGCAGRERQKAAFRSDKYGQS
ncbi:hypothetical protein GCM10017044_12480 [Kordiimonas sediminis]|uniref:Uncharacterized protein n=1 Tax=Kordiimonas sediminis TaxID=1735581 RepID=A0A919E6N3_9PROT|nr:hypothetical protein GCM10017044_12480 [Kordiimonas sediminis]